VFDEVFRETGVRPEIVTPPVILTAPEDMPTVPVTITVPETGNVEAAVTKIGIVFEDVLMETGERPEMVTPPVICTCPEDIPTVPVTSTCTPTVFEAVLTEIPVMAVAKLETIVTSPVIGRGLPAVINTGTELEAVLIEIPVKPAMAAKFETIVTLPVIKTGVVFEAVLMDTPVTPPPAFMCAILAPHPHSSKVFLFWTPIYQEVIVVSYNR